MPGYASEQMVEPVYAPEEPVTQQPMAEPRPLPAPGAPHELLAAAMAGVHGMGMPMFAPTNVSFDAMALQQHLAAMTAAAQAAQQAYAAVAAAGMAEPPTLKPAPVPGDKGRPVFHIQAVAGPAVPAPRFVMPTDTGCDTHMADAS